MEPFPIEPKYFAWLFLATTAITFGCAVLLRRAQRLPFFRPEFPDVEVQQSWRSGASSVGLVGSLGPANNCLWSALTGDTLHVGPHFPFNMFMPRFIIGLDLTIPIADITAVSEKTASFVGDYVRVEYKVTDAQRGVIRKEYVDLWPRRGDHFFNILHEKVRVAHQRRNV